MPAGNPAGYLPIPKRFKRRGLPVRPYIPKALRNQTGGAMAPNRLGPSAPRRPNPKKKVGYTPRSR